MKALKKLGTIQLSKRQKIMAASILSVLVIAAVIAGARAIVQKKASGTMQTYVVRTETYENVIEVAGTVSAAKEQSLQAKNDGAVVAVYAKEGDSVKKGDLILQEDDSEQVYNLAKLDYQIKTTKITGAQREIELLETQRTSLVQKISDRKIVATFDGVIASLDVDVGDYLEAKDSIGTLVDTSYLTAEVEVAETDVAKLKVGQKVEISFAALSEKVEGYLWSYPAIGEVTSRGATVVNAKIRIDKAPKEVLPNFSFTGKIQITEPEQRLVVERYAIGHTKGETFVEIVGEGGKTTKVAVEVRPYGSDYVNVVSGLEGGEILKAQSSASKSGRMRVNSKRDSSNKNQSQQAGAMMGGMGGPPPGGF